MKTLRKCRDCGRYTLKTICPECGGEAIYPYPMRFSLIREQKFRKYLVKDRQSDTS